MRRTAKHHPLCDTQLGPDFKVADGVVTMTIFACLGDCWDDASDDA